MKGDHKAWVAWNSCQGPFYETCAWQREDAERMMREQKLDGAGCVVVPISVRINRKYARERLIDLKDTQSGHSL
jgi:hypothetical protein